MFFDANFEFLILRIAKFPLASRSASENVLYEFFLQRGMRGIRSARELSQRMLQRRIRLPSAAFELRQLK